MASIGSFTGGAMKVFGKVMDNPSINSFFVASSFSAMAAGATGTTMDAMHDSHSLDPNTFERAGQGVGGALTGMADIGVAGMWLGHGIRRVNPLHKEAFSHGGESFVKQGGGLFSFSGGKMGAQVKIAEAEAIMSKGAGGVIGSGKWSTGFSGGFLKNAGWKMMAGTVLAPMAMSMLVTPALGFAGKVVDELYDQSRKARQIKYDERYIVNQQQDMTTNQQVGAAMDNYQNKMMSMSRIYHSR